MPPLKKVFLSQRHKGANEVLPLTVATDKNDSLLAVDLGVRTGLALYGRDGRLRWYRSRNFGNPARQRR